MAKDNKCEFDWETSIYPDFAKLIIGLWDYTINPEEIFNKEKTEDLEACEAICKEFSLTYIPYCDDDPEGIMAKIKTHPNFETLKRVLDRYDDLEWE